jgi:hypothetical protein
MEVSSMNEEQSKILRAPFEQSLVSLLPKVTCRDCANPKVQCADQRHQKSKCRECKAYVSPAHIHIDYVGHAETTDRFLNADPEWNWEPLAFDADGLPKYDPNGGLWMRVTICGVTRLGYGDAQGKTGANAVKECIGDGLRNAGMRFGVALDLWAKSNLAAQFADKETGEIVTGPSNLSESWWDEWSRTVRTAPDLNALKGMRSEAWARKKAGHLDDVGWDRADELTTTRKAELEARAAAEAPAPAPVPDPSPPPVGEQSQTTPADTPPQQTVPAGATASSPTPPVAPGKPDEPVKLAEQPIGSTGLRKALIDGVKDALLARGHDPDTYIAEWAGGPFDRVPTGSLRKLSADLAFVATQQVKP